MPEQKGVAVNLPNKLTVLRVILVPFFVVFLLLSKANDSMKWIALALFIIASLTDLLDGKIARKYNLVTNFGKFMDPLADKMLVLAAMCYFVDNGQMPGWAVAIVLFREFAVSGLRLIAAEQQHVIAAAWSGKIKTAVTMVALGLMTVFPSGRLDLICTGLILVTTVYSGAEYFVKNRDVFRDID